ncbi:MAG: capsule assembly Wzi family protein [Acidobacteriaceae bacterium]|nr:capsule assembly Wzi family protein [Acidobacteriaceae bacterium]
MALRLYSLGYINTAFISMRPWTRRSLLHILKQSQSSIVQDGNTQAVAILARLNTLLIEETPGNNFVRGGVYGIESVYMRIATIRGQTLRDSYHLGETINNDYGRPYEAGFNNITGFSSLNEWKRFSLNIRGEYQHSPSSLGYSLGVSQALASLDAYKFTPLSKPLDSTIPYGYLAEQNTFRLVEASLSFHLVGHEISGGKTDSWMGPAEGGAFAWTNNAENIYAFRINRVEPLHLPVLSKLLGPIRYDFQVGSLKGHNSPRAPWVHSEMFAFRPTSNVEFGFQRTVIWGGEGHEPVTLHTFFRSFFSFEDTESDPSAKIGSSDPGARFTAFNFSWRLPLLTHRVTLYADSEAHDDVTPPSAPRRAAYRPGLYISQFPTIPKLDLRVEAVSTDTSTLRSIKGSFNYFEGQQRQGYTNKGQIFGDWIGREAKGGQTWLTYHLSASEWVQLQYLYKKTPKDFIPNGTTQHQLKLDIVKDFFRNKMQLHAWLQLEQWKAPIYIPGRTTNTIAAAQIRWFPKLRTTPISVNGK